MSNTAGTFAFGGVWFVEEGLVVEVESKTSEDTPVPWITHVPTKEGHINIVKSCFFFGKTFGYWFPISYVRILSSTYEIYILPTCISKSAKVFDTLLCSHTGYRASFVNFNLKIYVL